MATQPEQLDSRIEIVTAENIAFKYHVAGPFRRSVALLIDMLIQVGVFIGLVMAALFFGATGLGGIGIAVGLVIWFYGGLFETFWNGQTPGKRVMRLRVVSIEGQPITAMQAVTRNVLRFVDALPGQLPFALCQVGLFATASNDRFQRLGDLACGTMVVVEEGSRMYGVQRVKEPEAIRLAGLIPVNFEPSRSLARALSVYVERRNRFAFGRRAEIARHLGEPLRLRFNLPPQTSHDMLLCAVYHRAFIADQLGEQRSGSRRAAVPAAAPALPPKQARARDVENLLDQLA